MKVGSVLCVAGMGAVFSVGATWAEDISSSELQFFEEQIPSKAETPAPP
ncbi:MAG: hypothetical protein AAF226_01820 [Verrucomicrobiota bacterium]